MKEVKNAHDPQQIDRGSVSQFVRFYGKQSYHKFQYITGWNACQNNIFLNLLNEWKQGNIGITANQGSLKIKDFFFW